MVLNTLMNTMSLLRRCRVNPALTIQLFSQLFHFISAWLFNQLTSPGADTPGLRSHYWGAALRQRLMAIEGWAERQGLELAADCHLGHIVQVGPCLLYMDETLVETRFTQRLLSINLSSLCEATHVRSCLCFAGFNYVSEHIFQMVQAVKIALPGLFLGNHAPDHE